MQNVKMQVDSGKLVITVDLTKTFGPSKSGKTTIVATTSGNVSVDTPAGPVTVGLNVYRK